MEQVEQVEEVEEVEPSLSFLSGSLSLIGDLRERKRKRKKEVY